MTTGPGCPTCGAEVQPNWDWCHACGFDPGGHKPASWVPTSMAPPTPVAPQFSSALPYPNAAGGASPWTVPVMVAKPLRHILRTVLAVGGLVIVLLIAAAVLIGPRLFHDLEGTKAGSGARDPVAFTAADGAYTVNFVGPATTRQETIPGSNGMIEVINSWSGLGNAQSVHTIEFPATLSPEDQAASLKAGVDTLVAGTGISTPASIAGHSGLHFTGKIDHHDSVGIAFFNGTRLYIVIAEGPYVIKEPQLTAFLESFHLNAPA